MTTETPHAEVAPVYAPANTDHALIVTIALEEIHPSPLNPRKVLGQEALEDLAASIRSHGLLEPLVVRTSDHLRGPYELIAGERRWRACQLAGLTHVAARILTGVDDRTAIEMMVIENLQRQDLDPLEEAAAYKALADLGHTQTEIAAAVKKSQPTVAKMIGLLRLPEDVQQLIREGSLSPTHGVALLRFAEFPAVASAIAARAVPTAATSKWLAEQDMPFSWDLQNFNVVKMLYEHDAHFDLNICRSACPFGAYVSLGGGRNGYCLKPDHWKQLQDEADEAERQRVLAVSREAKTGLAGDKETDPVARRAATQALPRIETLKNAESFQYSAPPADCTAVCPCRAQALGRDGEVIQVCTDPKRLASLKMRATKAANAAKAQATKERRQQIDAQIGTLTAIGQREMAMITAAVLSQRSGRKEVRTLIDKLVPGLGDAMAAYDTAQRVMPLLVRQDLVTLQRLALAAILHGEMTDEYSTRPLVGWYLDQATPSAAVNAEIAREDRAIEEVLAADVGVLRAQNEASQAGVPLAEILMAGDEASILQARLAKKQARLAASHDETERSVLAGEIADLHERIAAMEASVPDGVVFMELGMNDRTPDEAQAAYERLRAMEQESPL